MTRTYTLDLAWVASMLVGILLTATFGAIAALIITAVAGLLAIVMFTRRAGRAIRRGRA